MSALGREGFRKALDDYRMSRTLGDREHRRATDVACRSISPQRLYGTPVALMFFEGAKRLRQAGVTIPGLVEGPADRIVVEAYPGVLTRRILGRRSYKNDDKSKQSEEQQAARHALLRDIANGALVDDYGMTVAAPMDLADDPQADTVDALLCAVQAAWAWAHRERAFGMPEDCDPLEGWIADPAGRDRSASTPPSGSKLIDSRTATEVARSYVLPGKRVPRNGRLAARCVQIVRRGHGVDRVRSSGYRIGGEVVAVSKRTGKVVFCLRCNWRIGGIRSTTLGHTVEMREDSFGQPRQEWLIALLERAKIDVDPWRGGRSIRRLPRAKTCDCESSKDRARKNLRERFEKQHQRGSAALPSPSASPNEHLILLSGAPGSGKKLVGL